MSLKMAKQKSAFHILKQQKILYKIRLILNAEDENSRFPSAFFFMYQVHERKKSCHILPRILKNLDKNPLNLHNAMNSEDFSKYLAQYIL